MCPDTFAPGSPPTGEGRSCWPRHGNIQGPWKTKSRLLLQRAEAVMSGVASVG